MRRDNASGDRSVAVAMVSCSQAGPTSQPSLQQTADAIYIGGDIVTVNDAQPTAEALAVKDGKILAVGARSGIEQDHKGASTTMVDLGGKTLLPAFIDAHGHVNNLGELRIQAH